MKLTLTKIVRSNKDKDGKPLTTKDGRPYERIAIQTTEYGDTWLSGFSNQLNANWKEKDVIDAEVEEKVVNGKTYRNFRGLGRLDLIEQRLERLEKFMTKGSVPVAEKESVDYSELPF